ncbi:uncharacterized protein CDV56_102959 [Aspergillus thermomutatus]|uniref:Uncharacterized protein n=1 Tax=Aspergillus thermomutatus TaxID=41047 RepID=A0A397GRJ3_ASPTH|nr:uncharacterized protein CDV56_102959 [Aspergillus thermomutatus]RHZ50660.1 hypothetical protein CDV56_102959 [Aspergillus thermomutatus]
MTVTVQDFHVIIIGAGATGLLLAQGLKKHDEETYEQRAGQWTMALHSSLPYLESTLPPALHAKLNTATTNPWSEPDPGIAAAIPFVDGATGEVVAKIPMPHPKRVVRGKLRDLLRTDVEIRFGMRLTDVRVEDDGVVAVFNGEMVRGSVLVGADGARCVVRAKVVDTEVAALEEPNIMVLNAFPSFAREQALFIHERSHPIVQLAPHPHQQTMANVVDPDKPETWVFHYCLSIWTHEDPPENTGERRALFRRFMARYCEPYKSAGEWLSEDTPIPGEKVVYHGADLHTEMDGYDESAYTRGKQDIDLSSEQMYAYHHWEEIMTSPLTTGGYGASRQ